MSAAVVHAEVADLPQIAALATEAFTYRGTAEFFSAVFPGLKTPEGHAATVEKYREELQHASDPDLCIKVVVPPSTEPLGCCLCARYEQPPRTLPGLSGWHYATEEDKEYAEHLRTERNKAVLRTFEQVRGPVIQIMTYAVKPSAHGKGLGGKLLEAITAWCRKNEHDAIVLSLPPAEPVYAKYGFKTVEDAWFALPERWQDRPRVNMKMMVFRH